MVHLNVTLCGTGDPFGGLNKQETPNAVVWLEILWFVGSRTLYPDIQFCLVFRYDLFVTALTCAEGHILMYFYNHAYNKDKTRSIILKR